VIVVLKQERYQAYKGCVYSKIFYFSFFVSYYLCCYHGVGVE